MIRAAAMVWILLALIFIHTPAAQTQPDILDSVLSAVGFDRSDLGYQPKGYWNRFPLDIPYRLPSFDDLFAEPLKLYDYSTVMANAVSTYLDSSRADSTFDGLYKLLYATGVDIRLGGFRSYSANLIEAPDGDDPLAAAIDRLYWLDGETSQGMSFGSNSGWPPHRKDSIVLLPFVPDTVISILAKTVANLAEAIRWRNLAFRKCDREDMIRAFAVRDLAETQGDGQLYHPEFDDLARSIDWPSLYYAALKTAAVAEWTEFHLAPVAHLVPEKLYFGIPTPFGKILFISKGHKKHFSVDADNCLLIVDMGQDVHYHGSVAATYSLVNPISLVVDLDGDDIYGEENEFNVPNCGTGLLGVGILLDRQGDDEYHGSIYSQGAGLFGVGVLFDRFGDDLYKAEVSAQGCGYFGIGQCLDGLGNDMYYIHGDGQGLGGIGGGVGICASFAGNDNYTAEPFARVVDRGDYHSDFKINANNAQGAGFGRRGDGSDGHAWAGGLGAIIDIHGKDNYYSGNWSLGVGYWFGTGIAYDRYGDDRYQSCYFTQGSGAHFCNGILIDENGNDRHELFETAGAALGFGWDFTNALFIDKGGDDYYKAKIISIGLAQIRSTALFIDIGGDDEYHLGQGTPGLGEATFREGYDKPLPMLTYYYYAKSFGGFIDIGGVDKYYEFDSKELRLHPLAHNQTMWLQPSADDSTFGSNNFGVGIDADTGTIPELYKFEK